MQRCTHCGAASPDNAQACPSCGHPFGKGSQQKKKRSFLAGLLFLLGIRRDPQTGSLGCALIPATISVTLVAVIILGVMVGPVLKLIPPFAASLTVIGTVVPGGSVVVHGTNFPLGSHINLTLDGARSNSSITVRSDGTFDALVSIPGSWQPNSQHIIQAQAIGQDGSVQAQVQQTVTIPGSLSNSTLTQGSQNPSLTTTTGTGVTSTGSPSLTTCSPGAAGSGTNLNFSFSGAAPSPMCVVQNFKCSIYMAATAYNFDVLGVVNGTSYILGVEILFNYSGPSTYTDYTDLILNGYGGSTGQQWEAKNSGKITVNGDEKSGSVDALLTPLNSNSPGTVPGNGTVQITGNWACSTLERNP